jgi:hypothetical protein
MVVPSLASFAFQAVKPPSTGTTMLKGLTPVARLCTTVLKGTTRDTIGVDVFSHPLTELCVGAWRASAGVPPASKG